MFLLLSSYLVEFITSGPVVAMELKGSNAIEKWRTLLGPTDSATARNKAPTVSYTHLTLPTSDLV